MTTIIEVPDCVLLFSDIVDDRTQFLIMLVQDNQPVATPSDPSEFLHHMSTDYERAILVAEELAAVHSLQVYDRVVAQPLPREVGNV